MQPLIPTPKKSPLQVCYTFFSLQCLWNLDCIIHTVRGLPWWHRGWSVCLQCRRPGFDPWVRKIRWRRKWQSTPVLLPGKSHGWRSLIGYSPWCRRVGHDWATSLSLLISKTFSQIRKSVPKCNANYISKFHIFLRHSAFIKKQIFVQ